MNSNLNFILDDNNTTGKESLAQEIIYYLKSGKKVLWLVSGGSNIPITIYSMNRIRDSIDELNLRLLNITLTDERFGAENHRDSNWKQLTDAGLKISNIKTFPILNNKSLQDTEEYYSLTICNLIKDVDIIIGQFGIGSDGHIAGILPHSPAVNETKPIATYMDGKFTRMTLTFPILRKINIAYLFAIESNKEQALKDLREDKLSLQDEPAQILKEIQKSTVFVLKY